MTSSHRFVADYLLKVGLSQQEVTRHARDFHWWVDHNLAGTRSFGLRWLTRHIDNDLFTIQAEDQAVRQLIARERDVDAGELVLINISDKGYGRIYFGAYEPKSGQAFVWSVFYGPRAELRLQHASEGEIKKLQKVAERRFGIGRKQLTVLEPLYLVADEIRKEAK